MALDYAQQQYIVDLRGRVLRGEQVTPEELRQAITTIRASRGAIASRSGDTKTTKRKAPVQIDLDALFADDSKKEPG